MIRIIEGASKLLIANSTGSSANVTTVKALAKPIQVIDRLADHFNY